MKVSTAKKIRNVFKGLLSHWSKAPGGYYFSEPSVYLTIGKPMGLAEIVNLETIQAKVLDDCLTQAYADEVYSRQVFGENYLYPEITLGKNFMHALERASKIVSEKSPRNYGTVALVANNNNSTNIVATDGFMIYEHNEIAESSNYSFCLGVKHIKVILAFFEKTDTIVARLSDDKSVLTLESGNKRAFIQVSKVKFPNYKPVMPDFTNGHTTGLWDKTTPKVKGSIAAIYDYAETTFFGKSNIKIGTIKNDCRLDFVSAVYNPKYIDFVNESKKEVGWHQSKKDPSVDPIVFRTTCAYLCVETIVIVPITYNIEELNRMRA